MSSFVVHVLDLAEWTWCTSLQAYTCFETIRQARVLHIHGPDPYLASRRATPASTRLWGTRRLQQPLSEGSSRRTSLLQVVRPMQAEMMQSHAQDLAWMSLAWQKRCFCCAPLVMLLCAA